MYPCVWTAGATLVVVVMAAGVFCCWSVTGFCKETEAGEVHHGVRRICVVAEGHFGKDNVF